MTDNPSMTVVQRQSRAITRDILYTEDPDNEPRDITYDIINSPNAGRLVFADQISKDVKRFTQKDIDDERVIYFHDGSQNSVNFYFRVADGRYKPVYRHFRIVVIPLEIQLINRTIIHIQQGTKMAYITSANMGVATNGQRSLIKYNITHGPRGGQLYMNEAPASMFSQLNVDNEEVVFVQNNMSLANDSYFCTISNQDAILYDQMFQVEVTPLVRKKMPFVAYIEQKTAMSQDHLDASQLSGLTNSNPVYFILTPPSYGKIMRIVRASGSNAFERPKRAIRDKEVWRFSHEDVKNNVIHYVADSRRIDRTSGVNDSFEYRLVAPGVQPANGVFNFQVVSQVNQSLKKVTITISYNIKLFSVIRL